MGCASLTTSLADTRLILRADRTAFLPDTATLLLADIHLGKAQSLRSLGAPLSAGLQTALLDEPLARWAEAIRDTCAARVIVLGDLLHAPVGLTAALIDHVAAWRRAITCPISVVPGNHDRRLEHVAGAWEMAITDACIEYAGLLLTHDPADADALQRAHAAHLPLVGGHVHPALNLPAACGPSRAPVFAFGAASLTLPAFTTFAAGAPVNPASYERLVAIAGDELVPLAAPPRRTPSTP